MSVLKNVVPLVIVSAFVAFYCTMSSAQTVGSNYQCNFTVFPVKGSGPGFAPVLNSINRYDRGVGYMPAAPDGVHIEGFFRNANGSTRTFTVPKSFSTRLKGINDLDVVVGGDQLNSNGVPGHGFKITKGHLTLIDFPGANTTLASGINNNGDIVGSYSDSQNKQHGFVLKSGAFNSIDFPGAAGTEADGINDNSIIVGTYNNPDLTGHGFVLSQGQTTTLDYPGAADTQLSGINNRGAIVGTFFQNSTVGGFVYQDGTFRQVVIPNTTASSQVTTNGINEFGDISGSVTITPTDLEAYIGTGCH